MKDKNKIVDIKINVNNPILKGMLYILFHLMVGIFMAFIVSAVIGVIFFIAIGLGKINEYLPIIFLLGIILDIISMLLESLNR